MAGIVIFVISAVVIIWFIVSYNGFVKLRNKTEMFPGNLIAGIFGFRRKPLYEINDVQERERVKVLF